MSMRLEQACHEKSRAEWAEDTVRDRHELAQLTAMIVAAELAKSPARLVEMLPGAKADLIAHATNCAFAIANAVTIEDVRRYGNRIDHA